MCFLVYLCLFVFIRGSSLLTIGFFPSNHPHGRAGREPGEEQGGTGQAEARISLTTLP